MIPNRKYLTVALLVAAFAVGLSVVASLPTDDTAGELSFEMEQKLSGAVREWIGEQTKDKNADGVRYKRGNYSRNFRPVDDSTYLGSANIDTAGESSIETQRFDLTIKKEGGAWKVSEGAVVDAWTGLHRTDASGCYPFDSFKFDREGMKMSASNGTLCANYYQGDTAEFMVHSDDMKYEYAPPDHAAELHLADSFHTLDQFAKKDHASDMVFEPVGFFFRGDPVSSEEIISSSFTGLKRPENPAQAASSMYDGLESESWLRPMLHAWREARRDSAFSGFRRPYDADNRLYDAFVAKDVSPMRGGIPGPGVVLSYNNWGGFEVEFSVIPRRWDLPDQLAGTLFGYYTEETVRNTDPYDIERRDDLDARWYEVTSLKGDVDMALEDPEILKGRLEFGIKLKQDLRELPFFIASIPRGENPDNNRARTLFVNSIQYDGQDLTWVKTGPISGLVVLPDVMPAGTEIKLNMDFATRAIYKVNHAFSAMNRFGWMPFVRFGDFIDDFELTIRSPSKYKILGIGHKVDQSTEGEITTSRWKADSPVVFPTIIFGKYVSDTPSKEAMATKLDGTEIPVEVHVDEVSMGQMAITINSADTASDSIEAMNSGARGIRGKQLRPIATQAAMSINLFKEISGLDYPYGELNLVNDPAPALYGQAPSSLIYLGSLVFRGEGTMAGGGLFGGGDGSERTAKFLKSVVAHEVGHQWWGSRISNANFRNYWFVESLAEYFSAIYLEQAFGKKEYDEQVDEWRWNILNSQLKVSVQNADALWQGESGGARTAAIYNKGPYAFHMLRETFGDEKFFKFLKQFSMELAAKREIVTLDIQRAAEKALGGVDPEGNPYNVDLGWFFDQWIRGVGVPEYSFNYKTRKTEDGSYLVEGVIKQRVVVGSSRSKQVLPGRFYRGVVDITVDVKGESYERRLVVEGAETPFRLKVPKKPLEVALNKSNEILAHDVLVNQDF